MVAAKPDNSNKIAANGTQRMQVTGFELMLGFTM